jgi:phosphatidylglycerophosphate synthase
MLDRAALALLRPLLQGLATGLVRLRVGADSLTLLGLACGLAAATAIALHAPLLALALMAVGRLLDGLDGAVARLTKPTDRGAFLDITADFLFYASIPLAFALADPTTNALAAAVLLLAPGPASWLFPSSPNGVASTAASTRRKASTTWVV